MPDIFPFARRLFGSILFPEFQITLTRFPAEIAFYDEFHTVFIQCFDEFPVVVTGIDTNHDLPEINFQRFHLFQTAPDDTAQGREQSCKGMLPFILPRNKTEQNICQQSRPYLASV